MFTLSSEVKIPAPYSVCSKSSSTRRYLLKFSRNCLPSLFYKGIKRKKLYIYYVCVNAKGGIPIVYM
jgi:hypothetical protein